MLSNTVRRGEHTEIDWNKKMIICNPKRVQGCEHTLWWVYAKERGPTAVSNRASSCFHWPSRFLPYFLPSVLSSICPSYPWCQYFAITTISAHLLLTVVPLGIPRCFSDVFRCSVGLEFQIIFTVSFYSLHHLLLQHLGFPRVRCLEFTYQRLSHNRDSLSIFSFWNIWACRCTLCVNTPALP